MISDSPTSFMGAIDKFSPNGLSGWVFDKNNVGVPSTVSVLVNGRMIAEVEANLPRPDLATVVGDEVKCGFEVFFRHDVLWNDVVLVQATSADEVWALPNKSWSEVEGHVEVVSGARASGWVWLPRFPDSKLTVFAKLDGSAIASAQAKDERVDLLESGRGSGAYGFHIEFDRRVSDLDSLEFFAVGDGIESRLHVTENTISSKRHAEVGAELVTFGTNSGSNAPAVREVERTRFETEAETSNLSKFPSGVNFQPQGSFPCAPLLSEDKDGQKFGLSIDRVVTGSCFQIITGWYFGAISICFCDPLDQSVLIPAEFARFERNDVAAGYGQHGDDVHGFVAVWNTRKDAPLGVVVIHEDHGQGGILVNSEGMSAETELDTVLSECRAFAGLFLRTLYEYPQVSAKVCNRISELPAHSPFVRGYIETARGVPGEGGLVIGWLISEPGVELYLVSNAGHIQNLRRAARWNRPDIIEAMGTEFGSYAQNAGMLQIWPHAFQIGEEIKIIAVIGDQAFVVSSSRWVAAPVEPVGFARWAFSYSTPPERFAERLSNHDGPLIRKLISRAIVHRPTDKVEILTFGRPSRESECSVIIPLYRRYDFMLNQLIEFERDSYLVESADIVYVIDDPNLVGPVQSESKNLYKRFGVPFRVVWGGQNRGFAGANNLGVAHSIAPYILMLNSDVIPTNPGWLLKMIQHMDEDEQVGILGARLHFPNGSIQHDGMAFRWEPDWNAYLNKHPGAGLKLAVESVQPVDRPAVTAACAVIRRDDYLAVGGLDEGFLIGDFEDSDLCLKIRHLGKKIRCMQDIDSLIHLERQSFSVIGNPGFRDYVARFNAWQHQLKWGSFIDGLPSYQEFTQ